MEADAGVLQCSAIHQLAHGAVNFRTSALRASILKLPRAVTCVADPCQIHVVRGHHWVRPESTRDDEQRVSKSSPFHPRETALGISTMCATSTSNFSA
jgi:hypothetical protein